MSSLDMHPVAGHIGVRVDTPLGDVLTSPDLADQVLAATYEHHVVIFPAANPSPSEHLAFAELFGEPIPPEGQNPRHPDHDLVTVFDSDGGYRADRWHSDVTFRSEVPGIGILCMRTLPAVGGDTMFSNCTYAYEQLSGGMKKLLDKRRAWHETAVDATAEHPVVIAHPVTGEPALFVNHIFTRRIMNLPEAESAAILPFLLAHIARPEFTYRHQWQLGDIVMWDNWSTQHYALFDYTERRTVDRVTLRGQPLEPHRL